MRKNFGPKTYFFPLPVLLIGTYNEDGSANAMNAAWGGVYDTNQIMLCLDASHKTSANVKERGAFSIAFADKKHVVEADYLGIDSGNKVVNKLEKANLKTEKSEFVDAPILVDFPVNLDCKVKEIKEENDTLYVVSDILNVSCKEEYLDEQGKIDISKIGFISFNPVKNEYVEVNGKVGNAFKDGLKLR